MVLVKNEKATYTLVGGTTNANWHKVGGNSTVNVVNDFNASGSDEHTTGTAVGNVLTLANAKDFKDGQGISIYRAGADISLISAPAEAPEVYQSSGSSSWVEDDVIYVAYSFYGRGETSISPVASATITADSNEIRFKVDLPFATRRLGIYCGTNPAALKRIGWVQVDGGVSITDGGGSGIESLLVFPHDKPQNPFVVRVRRVAAGGGSDPVVATTTRSDFGSIGLPIYGETGSTQYDYYVVALSPRGGITRADATGFRSNGNAVLSETNYLKVEWPMVNTMAFAVYGKSSNPEPSRGLLAIVVGRTYYEDKGQGPFVGTLPPHIPSLPPSAAIREIFTTKIVSGGGTTSLTLEDAVDANVTAMPVYHDDTPAFQAALSYLETVDGGQIIIDAGEYNISSTLNVDVAWEWNANLILSGTSLGTKMKLLPGCHIPMLGQSTGTDNQIAVFNCVIRDIEFDGRNYEYTYGTCCSANAAEWLLHYVKTRFFYDGWMMRGTTYSGGGINGAAIIDSCYIVDCTHVGIVLPIDGLLLNSYVGGCGKTPSWDTLACGAYLPAWANVVSGCKFWDNRTHLIINSAGNVITDNVFEASNEHMILLVGIAYRNIIQSNRLNPNIVESPTWDIIRFQQIFGGESGQYNHISNNFCQPPLDFEHKYRHFVVEDDNCNYNFITGNMIIDATSDTPFVIEGADTVATNNYYNTSTEDELARRCFVDAYLSANQEIPADTATVIDFDTELEDTLGNFDTSTNLFTAPTAGIYQLCLSLNISGSSDPITFIVVRKNDEDYLTIFHEVVPGLVYKSINYSGLLKLEAADTVDIYAYLIGTVETITISGGGAAYSRLTITKL